MRVPATLGLYNGQCLWDLWSPIGQSLEKDTKSASKLIMCSAVHASYAAVPSAPSASEQAVSIPVRSGGRPIEDQSSGSVDRSRFRNRAGNA